MSDDEIDLGPVVTIEHDKSGRATCKSVRCLYDSRTYDEKLADAGGKKPKIKGAKIEKGVLRVQKKVDIAAFGDHEVVQNYHLACFCKEQTHSRPSTHIVESTDQLKGFKALKRSEQEIVTKMLERSVTLWNRWKGHMTRRTFTEDEEKERADESEDWLKMVKGEEITERHYDYDANDINALKKAASKRKAESAAESGESPKKRVKKEPKVKGEDEDETSVKKETKVKKETGVKKEPGVKKEAGVKKESKAADASNDGFDTSGYALEEASNADKKKTMFQKMVSRPPTLGIMKTIPDGAPDCLSGLTFVLSGVLDSLTYEDAKRLIENYGGRVTSAVSGKTSYLLRGEDAGATKTSKAEQLSTKIIDEDGLIELLKTMPAGGGGSAVKSKPKAKRAPKKKKNSDDEDEEEEDEEEEKPKPLTKQVGKRAMPSFL